MEHGWVAVEGQDEAVPFGYFSVQDWIVSTLWSFPAPWSLAPLDNGKYYETQILDARGVPVLSVFVRWGGPPSDREKAKFGHWTPEAWADHCCDYHYESEATFAAASSIVTARHNGHPSTTPDEETPSIVPLVLQYATWHERVWADVTCGGPHRRALQRSEAGVSDE